MEGDLGLAHYPDLVLQKPGYFLGLTHFRLAECGCRQAIQARPEHSTNRMVPPSRGLSRWHLLQVDLFTMRAKNKLPSLYHHFQTSQCGKWMPTLGGSGPLCLPSSNYSGQSSNETKGQPFKENNSNFSRVAQLLLASGSYVMQIPLCLPTLPILLTQPINQILWKNLSNLNLHAYSLSYQGARLL